MSTARGLIRQGDVLLVPVDPELANGEAVQRRRDVPRVGGRLVLVEGETTGHAHAILDTHARLEVQEFGEHRPVWINRGVWSGSRIVLFVEDVPATLEHEEHDPLLVAPGSYEVRRQREYAPASDQQRAGWRTVAD
jgi:hypothetical protein